MGTRKGDPFSRRAYNQGWGILSKSILGLLGLGVCAARGIKSTVENNSVSSVNANKIISSGIDSQNDVWENFFGINLKESPNELWVENGFENTDGKIIRKYLYCGEADVYFNHIEATVVNDNQTNFLFRGDYKLISAINIYFIIEDKVMSRKNFDVVTASKEVRNIFDSVYDRIEWKNDSVYMEMSRDIETGDIELIVLAPFYNGDFFKRKEETGEYECKHYDEKITIDTIVDGGRYLVSENLALCIYGESNYIYTHLSCCKEGNRNTAFFIGIDITNNSYMHVSKGELMLIKLENGEILEFDNISEKESDIEDEFITLAYVVSEEQIDAILLSKIVKIRISVCSEYIDIDVSKIDVARYITNMYFAMNNRLSKNNSIYDNF